MFYVKKNVTGWERVARVMGGGMLAAAGWLLFQGATAGYVLMAVGATHFRWTGKSRHMSPGRTAESLLPGYRTTILSQGRTEQMFECQVGSP